MKLLSLTICLLLGAALTAHASVFARFADANGASHYAEVNGATLSVLTAAPWNGGQPTGATIPVDQAHLLPPTEPRNVIGLAKAYAGKDPHPPKTISWFAKSPSAPAANGEDVPIPPVVAALKVEVELVIIIGKRVKSASSEEARAAIFGYCTGTEIFGFTQTFHQVHGEADQDNEGMLPAGLKLGDKMAPYGPYIHTNVDWRGRARTLRVIAPDGQVSAEYHNSTDGLLYSPEEIVRQLSQLQTLEAGDVIFSGTTKSFIVHAGDVVETEIAGLGKLRNRIVASPTR